MAQPVSKSVSNQQPAWMAALHQVLANPLYVALVLLVLSLVLYGNTIGHEYASDDAIVITQNGYTQEGFAGIGKIFTSDAFEAFFKAKKDLVAGGRYRPLSIATFAVEYQFFGLNPHVSHTINILLYWVLGWLVFLMLQSMLKPLDKGQGWLAFLATIIFMAHPIHTEVVANIKGRDEILAMIGAIFGTWRLLKYSESGSMLELVWALLAFFLGALSKETAIPFLAIAPLAMWFKGEKNISKLGMAAGSILVAVGTYWILRTMYAGGFTAVETTEKLNDPFVGATYGMQVATAAKTVVLYLGLLLVPATLTHDYYYNQVPVVGFSDPLALLGMALVAGSAFWAVKLILKKNYAGFGIAFFLLSFSIVSNVVFPIGTTMGERFMFVPSLGFILAVLVGLQWLFGKVSKQPAYALTLFTLVVVGLFAVRTILRNPVWENDFVLFTTDVENSPNSAKVQTAAGGALSDEAVKPENAARKNQLLQQALVHLNKAVQIYPEHGTAWLIKGNSHYNLGQYAEALQAYKQVLAYRPGMTDAYKNAGLAAYNAKDHQAAESYFNYYMTNKPQETDVWVTRGDNFEAWGKAQEAIDCYKKLLEINPKDNIALGKIGMVYGKRLGNYDMAISYLQQALAANPKEVMHHENLGIALAMKGDLPAALQTFQEGLKVFPNNPKLLRNLGITYAQMGDTVTGQRYIQQAQQAGG